MFANVIPSTNINFGSSRLTIITLRVCTDNRFSGIKYTLSDLFPGDHSTLVTVLDVYGYRKGMFTVRETPTGIGPDGNTEFLSIGVNVLKLIHVLFPFM